LELNIKIVKGDPLKRVSSDEMNSIVRFHRDDRGEHAIEFLMILTFGILPLIATIPLLQDILKEYVAFGQIFVTSPFF